VRATGRAIASVDRLFEAFGCHSAGPTALRFKRFLARLRTPGRGARRRTTRKRAYLIFGNNEFGLPAAGHDGLMTRFFV